VFDERDLGPLIDKGLEWHSTAVFTHEEAETIISDARKQGEALPTYGVGLRDRPDWWLSSSLVGGAIAWIGS